MDETGVTPEQRITELTERLAKLERHTDRVHDQHLAAQRQVRTLRYLLPVLGGLTSTFLAWPSPVGWRTNEEPMSNAFWDTLGYSPDVPAGWMLLVGTLGLAVVIAGSIRAFRRSPVTRSVGLAATGAALAVSVVIAPAAMGIWHGARIGDLAGPFLMFVSAVAFAVVCLTDPQWATPPGRAAPQRGRST